MRNAAMKLVAGLSLMVLMASAAPETQAQGTSGLDSGALGRLKSEIEADFGPSGTAIEMPGHPVYDEPYAYLMQAGTLYVSYREINGEDVAVYVEFQWVGDGVDEATAHRFAASLLPSDAELTELYIAPPTSSGPVALVTHRYVSDALTGNPALAPEILVIYQETWGDPENRLTAVSISIRERTQATG